MEKPHATKAVGGSPDEFAIRPASPEDTAAILQCLRIAFEPYRSQYTPQAYLDVVMTPDTLLKRLTSMTVLVALDTQGTVVGTIGGAVVSSSEGHLRGMAVLPGWHGRGTACPSSNTPSTSRPANLFPLSSRARRGGRDLLFLFVVAGLQTRGFAGRTDADRIQPFFALAYASAPIK